MDCKYSHRLEKDSNNRNYIYCNKLNEKCPIVRFCNKVNNIINSDNYETKCKIYMEVDMEEKRTNDAPNKVLFQMKNKKLVVELNDVDQAIQVDNPYDYIPQYVKLCKRRNGEYYIKK